MFVRDYWLRLQGKSLNKRQWTVYADARVTVNKRTEAMEQERGWIISVLILLLPKVKDDNLADRRFLL